MARTCLIPPQISVLKSAAALVKPVSKMKMFKSTKFTVNKTLTFQIRSSIKNKVFEDLSKGIICYRDDNGEIICEGYDDDDHHHVEPCFHQYTEKKSTYPRSDLEVKIDLILQQSWFPMVKLKEQKKLLYNEGDERGDHRVNGYGFTSYVSQFELYVHVLLIIAFIGNRS